MIPLGFEGTVYSAPYNSGFRATLMSGSGGGGGIGWVGQGRGAVFAFIARRQARKRMYEAVEADMAERGLPIPPRPMSQEKIFAIGFMCGLLLGLLIGLIVWEVT
jgi:hypothetical protein